MVSLKTGPAETRLPIEFCCFDIAEAVGLRAGQQQDVSLFRTKHTDNTEIPKAKLSASTAGRSGDEACRVYSLTGIKSFFFRRMTSPTWISFHLATLNLNIKNNDRLLAFSKFLAKDLELFVLEANDSGESVTITEKGIPKSSAIEWWNHMKWSWES